MSPFSTYLYDLRTRHGLRQGELAVRLGYEQSYISALELGTKGPPTDEFVSKLIQVLDLEIDEQEALLKAIQESQRKYLVPNTAPADVFKLVSELWGALETLHPAQVAMMRDMIHLKSQLQTPCRPDVGRVHRKRREVAKM